MSNLVSYTITGSIYLDPKRLTVRSDSSCSVIFYSPDPAENCDSVIYSNESGALLQFLKKINPRGLAGTFTVRKLEGVKS
jgi:hypothetical protein